MNEKDVQAIILERLYDSWFRGRNAVNLNTLCDEFGLDKTLFWNTVDYMSHQGLIRADTMGRNYVIDSIGVLSAEEHNIGLEEIRKENQQLRTVVMDKLAKFMKKTEDLQMHTLNQCLKNLRLMFMRWSTTFRFWRI